MLIHAYNCSGLKKENLKIIDGLPWCNINKILTALVCKLSYWNVISSFNKARGDNKLNLTFINLYTCPRYWTINIISLTDFLCDCPAIFAYDIMGR
jgi:hypothetical protein